MSIGFLLASPQSRILCELSAAVWFAISKLCNVVFFVLVVAAVVKSDGGSFRFLRASCRGLCFACTWLGDGVAPRSMLLSYLPSYPLDPSLSLPAIPLHRVHSTQPIPSPHHPTPPTLPQVMLPHPLPPGVCTDS